MRVSYPDADLHFQPSRLREDFDALADIGSIGDGGVHRPAFSEAHLEARGWFRQRVLAASPEFAMDGAGDHCGRLPCGPSGAPTLVLGCHLDSEPHCGRFDGALVEKLGSHAPQPLHPQVQGSIRAAAQWLGLSCQDLASDAAHDAQMMASVCPAGMIFVPMVDGFSHSHREETAWEDCLLGAQTLLQAALRMGWNRGPSPT